MVHGIHITSPYRHIIRSVILIRHEPDPVRETFLPAVTSSVCNKDRGIFYTTIVSGFCVNSITVFDYKQAKKCLALISFKFNES